jgi:hypothetical protein
MKALIYGIYIVFALLMGFTIYRANSVFDGLVDDHYYQRGKEFFKKTREEESLGLRFSKPEELKRGKNYFTVSITAGDAPLSGGTVSLFTGKVSTTRFDSRYLLNEISPGVYGTEINLPSPGKWLIRIELRSSDIKTERIWFINVT